MKKVRIGIVGAGRLGGFHANKAKNNPNVELVGIVDVSQENRRRVAQACNVRDFETLEELTPLVDAVVVATPSVLHANVGRQVLQANKHLLVEKPATTSGKTALELATLAKERGLVMQVGHVEQYNPAWREALNRLEDARTGVEPIVVEATRTSGYTFRSTDVGATLDLMIHDLELVLSLIPSELERVSAFGYSQLGGYEDASFATLEFANGSIARLKASRIEQCAERKMTIQTPRQTVKIDFASRSATLVSPTSNILNGEFAPSRVSFADMSDRVATFMKEEYATEELVHEPFDALELEMQDFASAILYKTPSTVPGERAARAVAVAEMIIEDLNRRARRSNFQPQRRMKIAG